MYDVSFLPLSGIMFCMKFSNIFKLVSLLNLSKNTPEMKPPGMNSHRPIGRNPLWINAPWNQFPVGSMPHKINPPRMNTLGWIPLGWNPPGMNRPRYQYTLWDQRPVESMLRGIIYIPLRQMIRGINAPKMKPPRMKVPGTKASFTNAYTYIYI